MAEEFPQLLLVRGADTEVRGVELPPKLLPMPPVLIAHEYFEPRRIRDVEWTQVFMVVFTGEEGDAVADELANQDHADQGLGPAVAGADTTVTATEATNGRWFTLSEVKRMCSASRLIYYRNHTATTTTIAENVVEWNGVDGNVAGAELALWTLTALHAAEAAFADPKLWQGRAEADGMPLLQC